jgi:hypothetical protein
VTVLGRGAAASASLQLGRFLGVRSADRVLAWHLRPLRQSNGGNGRKGHFWGSLQHFVVRFAGMFLLNLFIWRRSPARGLTHVLI